jgi:hypothetical protein
MSRTRTRRAGLLAGLLLFLAGAASAQLPDGWSATFVQDGRVVSTHVASAAFVLEAGTTLHPELGAEHLEAVYGARLDVPAAGRYRFGVEVAGGAAQLSVTSEAREPLGSAAASDGQRAMTGWIELKRGAVELVLSFQRDEADAARLRVLWELEPTRNAGFPLEPIPSRPARPWAGSEARVAAGLEARRGRVLLERKGCTSCHAPGEAQREAVGVRRGPALARVGERAGVGCASCSPTTRRCVAPCGACSCARSSAGRSGALRAWEFQTRARVPSTLCSASPARSH